MRLVPDSTFVRPCSLVGLAAVLGAAALAGCGGGDDGPSEDALRSQLSAAFKRTDSARSIRTLDSFEVDTGDDGETASGCIDISIERVPGKGAKTERFALQSHVDDCAQGPVTGEMVLVRRSLWVSSGDGRYKPARIAPKLVPKLTEEGVDFGDLPSVATDIGLGDATTDSSDDGAPTYEFEAPGSALSDEIGTDSAEVDFTATTDSRGYLSGLIAEIEVEGANGKVEQTYEEIDQVPPIKPPPKKLVQGRPVQVESEGDLERLVANIVPEAL